MAKDIKTGEERTADKIKTVEVGGYNLPENVVHNKNAVIGKFSSADMVAGDYIKGKYHHQSH